MRLIFILISVAALTGCVGTGSTDPRVQVAAGFYPLAFAADEIGGARVEVTNLTPAGAEPHDLEISPQDVAAVRDADVVLLLGQDFQPQLEDAAGDGANVIRLLETPGLNPIPNDPHVWLDPVRYETAARRIAAALGLSEAAAPFVARLEELDAEFRRGLAHCARDEVVTSHEAFAYLTDRYGLEQVAITGPSPEAEASSARLQEIVDLVRSTDATTVFAEPLVSPRVVETIARETGADTAVLDPIEGLSEGDAAGSADYFSLMRQNLAALREGLGCS